MQFWGVWVIILCTPKNTKNTVKKNFLFRYGVVNMCDSTHIVHQRCVGSTHNITHCCPINDEESQYSASLKVNYVIPHYFPLN